MAVIAAFLEILERPTVGDVVFELMAFMMPIWVAVLVGVLVGWAWKPKWANSNFDYLDSTATQGIRKISGIISPQFTASLLSLSSLKLQIPPCISRIPDFGLDKDNSTLSLVPNSDYSSSKIKEKSSFVNEEDVKHLHRLVEVKDGGPAWIHMMDKSTPNMTYQAWRRDPETGPPQYRSRTVYEDATPEMVRDFFWDDKFRLKWDNMLIHAETLEECPNSGAMVVHWIRKFPFFCSDREYIIGQRIWESGRTYYCVTKGVPCSSVPRRDKPRRVDLYYSSWCIRAVESKRDGQLTSCEVLLFHHEDMGIPWEIAKLGVQRGMWGAVKKIDPGLRAYQKYRSSGVPLPKGAFMAQINTKFSVECLNSQDSITASESEKNDSVDKPPRKGISRMMVIGGAIALACSLDRGILTKAVIFGVARRFVKNGRRL